MSTNLSELFFYSIVVAVMIYLAIVIVLFLKQVFGSTPEEYEKANRVTWFPKLAIKIIGSLALVYSIVKLILSIYST